MERNEHTTQWRHCDVEATSRYRFDVMMTSLFRLVSAGKAWKAYRSLQFSTLRCRHMGVMAYIITCNSNCLFISLFVLEQRDHHNSDLLALQETGDIAVGDLSMRFSQGWNDPPQGGQLPFPEPVVIQWQSNDNPMWMEVSPQCTLECHWRKNCWKPVCFQCASNVLPMVF